MSIRSIHKSRIKALLESITYNTQPILAFDKVTTTADRFPYCFITSGAMNPNYKTNGQSMLDSGTYNSGYQYAINIVTYTTESIDDVNNAEVQIDDLEGLIVAKFRDLDVRNGVDYTTEKWSDVIITAVSEPINGADISLSDNYIIKTITILIEYQE